jgi:hypothetical protein
MTNKTRKSRWQSVARWTAALSTSAAMAATATGVVGAPPHACSTCRVCVDGDCRPNAETYGYYQTQWRVWPKRIAASTVSDPVKVKLPTQVEPPPAQEDLDNPPRPPASPSDMGDVPPIKPTTGDESPDQPKTDKPDPFQDDPGQDNSKVDPAAGEEASEDANKEMSILVPPADLIPPTNETADSYDAIDAAPAAAEAIQSSYDEQGSGIGKQGAAVRSQSSAKEVRSLYEELKNAKKTVVPVSDESDDSELRLVSDAVAPKATTPTVKATASESGNPLRSGWGARGESSLREPKVVTKFGGAGATNPLRK